MWATHYATLTTRKYIILLAVVAFAACGDVSLSRGMHDFGPVTFANLPHLLTALLNPWIVLGVLLLIGFFASYLSALSWADLTYVLPATSISYILMVLLARFFLHENVSIWRWLGVLLIVTGVGFVATGPEATPGAHRHNQIDCSAEPVADLAEVGEA
jgi:drug/metabolite transporter (DMT)-like permease